MKKSRLFAFLLSLSMILGLVPTPTLAEVSNVNTGGGSTLTSSTSTWNGHYVASTTTISNVKVTGDTTVYIPAGVTLTVKGTDGSTAYTGLNAATAMVSKAEPDSWSGKNAITINPNVTLTFSGPGVLIAIGGNGHAGANGAVAYALTMNQGAAGGRGGDGIYVGKDAVLNFDGTFSGTVQLRGGNGGAGGVGQQAAEYADSGLHTGEDATRYTMPILTPRQKSGDGGQGGHAGYGISNNGNVYFSQDIGNFDLHKEGGITTGQINVKGGIGGTGGNAGELAAGTGISNTNGISSGSHPSRAQAESTARQNAEDRAKAGLTGGTVAITSSNVSSTPSNVLSAGSYQVRDSQAGNGGLAGLSGYGINGGNIYFNRGTTGIEGGNAGGTSMRNRGASVSHHFYRNNNSLTIANASASCTQTDGNSCGTGTGSDNRTWYEPYEFVLSYIHEGYTYSVVETYAIGNAKIYNNGGTSFAIFGNNGAGTALYNTTVESLPEQSGTFFNGNGTSVTSNTDTTTSLRVKFIEGYGDFAAHAKNLYVLNAGDSWVDADGQTHVSEGFKVNGEVWKTLDVYVSPQGYLYLSGLSTGDTISFDLAIGASKTGNAGDEAKLLTFSSGGGVYHYAGNVKEGVTASWSSDADSSYTGSNFDLEWLKSTDFSRTVEIYTGPQLAAVAWAVNNPTADGGKYKDAVTAGYVLKNDIDLGNFDWTPIGTEENPFMGAFDGKGRTISNVRLRTIEGRESYGLFGTAVNARIGNLTITRNKFTHAQQDTISQNQQNSNTTSGGDYNIGDLNIIFVKQDNTVHAGVLVGHTTDSTIQNVTVSDVPVGATTGATSENGDVYVGGLVGLAENTDLLNNNVINVNDKSIGDDKVQDKSINFLATSTKGQAWSGGLVGKITGNKDTAAVVSGNKVTAVNDTTAVVVNARGKFNSYAGGIIGEALEVSVFSNTYLSTDNNASNQVKVYSSHEKAWAGGIIGHIQNEGYGKVAVSDMHITNIGIEADSFRQGAWAGGLIGQAYAYNGVELTNLTISGNEKNDIIVEGAGDLYAGRLAGESNKTTVVNGNLTNTGKVTITATIKETGSGDIYAAGLIGKLNDRGSINNTSVWNTDITVQTSSQTPGNAWVGGLLGYAEDTSITASHVNYREPTAGSDASANFSSSAITAANAVQTVAGGLAGEIINPKDTLRTANENSYKTNNAASITFTLPAENVTAGGLFGKINDALIATSYARDYTIKTAADGVPKGFIAGVAGSLTTSELIAVYGVGAGGNVITTYPGMYADGEGNRFYGSYVFHTVFAPHPEKDGNAYANTYYVDSADEATINYIAASKGVETIVQAEPYYVLSNDLYELRTTYNDHIEGSTNADQYKYKELTAVKAEYFTGNQVNDSMWNLLHFYRKNNLNDITTQYEQRVGYAINFNTITDNLWGNWLKPAASLPKVFTLGIQPGTDYGHMKVNVEGEPAYSSFINPGSKSYTPESKLIFTAEEQATLPSDIWFYSFDYWKVSSGADKIQMWIPGRDSLTDLSGSTVTTSQIRLVMPNSAMNLTAVFKRNDNYFRSQMNLALSKAMTAALAKQATAGDYASLGEQLQDMLDRGDIEEATALLIDNMDLGSSLNANGSVYKAFDQFLSNPVSKSPNTGNTFTQVYPNANTDLYKQLSDKAAVIKQMTEEAVKTVMSRDTFVAGSYEIELTQMTREDDETTATLEGGKVQYVDIGVDIFGSGKFNKYVSSQYVFEQSGTDDNGNNSRPGIASANGMDITISTVFNDTGNAAADNPTAPSNSISGDTYGHGIKGGLYLSYENPADFSSSGLDVYGNSIWADVEKNEAGKYVYALQHEKLVEDKHGKTYVYIKEVDANGYEVVTRLEVGVSAIAAENVKVNEQTTNIAIGNGEEAESGYKDSWALWWDTVQAEQAVDSSYKKMLHGGERDPYTTYQTQEISGAYAEGIYVEVEAKHFPKDFENTQEYTVITKTDEAGKETIYYEIPVKTDITLGTAQGLSKDDVFTGELKKINFTNGDFKSGSLTYQPVDGIVVKTKYVNMIGELNSAEGDDALAEVETLTRDKHFAETMGISKAAEDAFKKIADDAEAAGETCLIDQLLYDLRPSAGYANADEIKDLYTNAAALKELTNIVAQYDATIKKLTPADQTIISGLSDRAEILLAGDDPNTGTKLNPEKLQSNLNQLYTVAESLYKALNGIRYDTVVLTIQSNYPDKVILPGSLTSTSPNELLGAVRGSVFAQTASTASISLMSDESVLPTLKTKNMVLRKNTEATVDIIALTGYTVSSVKLNGEELALDSLTRTSDVLYKVKLTKEQTVTNLQLTVVFDVTLYDVTYPSEIKNDKDELIATITTNDLTDPTTDDDGSVTGSAEYQKNLTLQIGTETGYSVIPGTEVTYTMGGTEKKATVNPDGTIVIPNVTGEVIVTDVSKAVKSDKDALTDYLDILNSLALKRDDYTPSTWVNYANALQVATAAKDNADATDAEIARAMEVLAKTQNELNRQYEITVPGGFTIPDTSKKELTDTTGYADSEIEYLQNGVVAITNTESKITKYYVQEGKSAAMKQTNLAEGNTLKAVSYKEQGKNKTGVVNGNDTFVIPNVYGPITDIKTTEGASSFYVAADTSIVDKAVGVIGTTSADAYTIPDISVKPKDDGAADKVILTIGDFIAEINLTDNDGSAVVTITDRIGSTHKINLPADTLKDIVDPAEDNQVTVTSKQLKTIIDTYNKENKPVINVQSGTQISAEVKTKEDDSLGKETKSVEASPITVPTYTLTPVYGRHVESVSIDGTETKLPVNPTDSTDPNTGGSIAVDKNKGTVTVDDGINSDYVVVFHNDPEKASYGKAEVIFKSADVSNHTAGAEIKDNVYNLGVPVGITGGTAALVSGSNTDMTGKITHSNNAVLTLTPSSGMKVDLDATVTITVTPVGSNKEVIIKDTIRNLADKSKYPNLSVKNAVDGKVTITVNGTQKEPEEGITGPLEITVKNGFTAKNQSTETLITALDALLDELKQAIDLGDNIVDKKSQTAFPYVTDDNKWNAFAKDASEGTLAAAKDVYTKLTDADGKLLPSITGAASVDVAVDEINHLLDTGFMGSTAVTDFIADKKDDLHTSILNLTQKSNTTPVLPVFNEGVSADAGIDQDKLEQITINPTAGGVSSGNPLVLDHVSVLPGNSIQKVTISMIDPDKGTTTDQVVSIGDLTIDTNADGTKKVTISNEKIAAIAGDRGVIGKLVINTDEVKAFDGTKPTMGEGFLETAAVKGTITNTAGDPSNADTTITLGDEGITIQPIKPADGYVYKGIEITVLDKNKQTHVVYVPADHTNTQKKDTDDYEEINEGDKLDYPNDFQTAVTAEQLADAVKKQLGDVDLSTVVVSDVKVISDAMPLSDKLTNGSAGAGIQGVGTITKPSTGMNDNSSDLKVESIVTKPTHEIGGMIVDIIDPNTGSTIKVVIPVTDAENLPDGKVMIIQPNGNEKELNVGEIQGVIVNEKGDDKNVAVLPGASIDALLNALKADGTITAGVINAVTIAGNRIGYGLPAVAGTAVAMAKDAEAGVGVVNGGIVRVNDGEDDVNKLAIKVTEGAEALIIDQNTVEKNFSLRNVDMTVKNPVTGQPIIISVPVPSINDADTAVKVDVVYKDEHGDSHAIRVTVKIETAVTVDFNADTNQNKITIPSDALDAIISEAVQGVLTAEEIADVIDISPVDTDIQKIVVNAKSDFGITLPETAEPAGSASKTDTPKVTTSNGVQDVQPDKEGIYNDLILTDIQTAPNYIPDGTAIRVHVFDEARNEKVYEVKLPADYPATLITEPIAAVEINPDNGKPAGEVREIDLSKELGGSLQGNSPYSITIPGDTLHELVKQLSGLEEPKNMFISSIKVDDVKNGHLLPDTIKAHEGLSSAPSIRTEEAVKTVILEDMNIDKGITIHDVRAEDEDHHVKNVTLMIGQEKDTIITVTPAGELLAVKKGEPVDLTEALKDIDLSNVISNEGEPYTITLSPEILSGILEAAQESDKTLTHVDVNTEDNGGNAGQGIAVTAGIDLHTKLNKAPLSVSKLDDLLVDNIKLEELTDLIGITIITDDGTQISIPKSSSDGKITVTDRNGTSYEVELSRPVMEGMGTAVDSLKVTIPGAALDEILTAVMGAEEAKAADIRRISVDTVLNGWKLPTALEVITSNPDGLNSITMTAKKTGEASSAKEETIPVSDAEVTDYLGDEVEILLPNEGADDILSIAMNFKQDDFVKSGIIYHTLDALWAGGELFEVAELEKAGILTWVQGGNPLLDRTSNSGEIEINVNSFADYYEVLTGNVFPGFNDLKLMCVPQNTQYQSFIEDYEALESYLDFDGNINFDDADDRQASEDLVHKLIEQFREGALDSLSDENRSHLLDKKPVLADLEEQIREYERAELLRDKIESLHSTIDNDLNGTIDNEDADKSNLVAAKEQLEAAIDALNEAKAAAEADPEDADLEAAVEARQNELDALYNTISGAVSEDQKTGIDEAGIEYDTLSKKMQQVADPTGKLPELKDLLDTLRRVELGDVGYVSGLVVNLPECPSFDPDSDSIIGNTDRDGTVSERIDELVAYQKAIDQVQDMIDRLPIEIQKELSSQQDELDKAREKLHEESDKLAEIFVKEYATTDNKKYEGEGFSKDSDNGIKVSDANIADKVTDAVVALNKLPDSVQEAVDELFYGPTIREIYDAVVTKPTTMADRPATEKDLNDLLAKLEAEYKKYDQNDYTEENYQKLTDIYNQGVNDLKGALADDAMLSEMFQIFNEAKNDMAAIRPIGSTPDNSTFTITSTAGSHGAVSPSGETTVNKNGSLSIYFIPDTGYQVDKVIVDGKAVSVSNYWKFNNITANHTISVTFKVENTGNTGGNTGGGNKPKPKPEEIPEETPGSTPEETPDTTPEETPETPVEKPAEQPVPETPEKPTNQGFDNGNIAATDTETNANTDAKEADEFVTIIVTIDGKGGSISPSDKLKVIKGREQTFYFYPENGYVLDKVYVNGKEVAVSSGSITLDEINEDTTIEVTFKEESTTAEPSELTTSGVTCGCILCEFWYQFFPTFTCICPWCWLPLLILIAIAAFILRKVTKRKKALKQDEQK